MKNYDKMGYYITIGRLSMAFMAFLVVHKLTKIRDLVHLHAEAFVVQWQRAGLLANRCGERCCARGTIHNKFHLICPGCLHPSIALTVQNRGLKHRSFHSLNSAESWPKTPIIQWSSTYTICRTRQKQPSSGGPLELHIIFTNLKTCTKINLSNYRYIFELRRQKTN